METKKLHLLLTMYEHLGACVHFCLESFLELQNESFQILFPLSPHCVPVFQAFVIGSQGPLSHLKGMTCSAMFHYVKLRIYMCIKACMIQQICRKQNRMHIAAINMCTKTLAVIVKVLICGPISLHGHLLR